MWTAARTFYEWALGGATWGDDDRGFRSAELADLGRRSAGRRHTREASLSRRGDNSRRHLLNRRAPHGEPCRHTLTPVTWKEGLHGGGAPSRCSYGAARTSSLIIAPTLRSLRLADPRRRPTCQSPRLWTPNKREW